MSVVANVAINVDSRGAPAKLKQVADRTKQVDQAVRDMNGRLGDSRNRFVAAGNSANSASAGFAKLAGGALKLAAAYATLSAAQAAVRTGIQRIESERRIQFLAKQYGEVDQLARAAADASVRFGQSQTTANRAIADIYARLRPVGVSLEEIVSVYNGFNTAARISGSTAQESEAAFRQLSQALGSGALRGDEFNSIAEQVPGILTAISKTTGIAQGQLREYAAEGKITAEIVIAALQGIEKDGADQLTEALGGPAQAIKDFQNASEEVQVALTTAIVPQMAEAFRGLAELILNLEPAIKFIGKITADTLNQINSLIVAATSPGAASASRDIKAGLLPLNVQGTEELFRGTGPGGRGLAGMREESIRLAGLRRQDKKTVLLELMKNRLAAMEMANLPAPSETTARPTIPTMPTGGGGGGGAGTKAAANVMETDAQRAAKIQEIRAIERDIFEARRAGNEVLVAQLEAFKTQIEIKQRGLGVEEQTQLLLQNGERLNERLKELDDQRLERLSRFLQGTTELIQAQNDVIGNYQEETRLLELRAQKGEEFVQKFKDVNRLMMEGGLSFNQAFSQVEARTAAMASLNQEADLFQQALQGAGDIIGNQLRSAIDGLIDGTADWNNILRDTLSQLGSFFLNLGLNQLAGSDGKGILSFLGFGRASGGPVMPGNTYMVGERGPELLTMTPSGGYVTSNSASQAAMDRYSSGNTRGGSISVNYNVTEINGMKFVTEDQFRAGISQAAKQGAEGGFNRTMTSLKNSRSQRSKLGIGR